MKSREEKRKEALREKEPKWKLYCIMHERLNNDFGKEDYLSTIIKDEFENGEYEGILSNKEYADQYILTTRTWSNSTFVAGAVNGGATLEEANALTDEMFRQYSDRVAEDPINHGMDYVHGYMTFQKV